MKRDPLFFTKLSLIIAIPILILGFVRENQLKNRRQPQLRSAPRVPESVRRVQLIQIGKTQAFVAFDLPIGWECKMALAPGRAGLRTVYSNEEMSFQMLGEDQGEITLEEATSQHISLLEEHYNSVLSGEQKSIRVSGSDGVSFSYLSEGKKIGLGEKVCVAHMVYVIAIQGRIVRLQTSMPADTLYTSDGERREDFSETDNRELHKKLKRFLDMIRILEIIEETPIEEAEPKPNNDEALLVVKTRTEDRASRSSAFGLSRYAVQSPHF